jgi:hypothetical protein
VKRASKDTLVGRRYLDLQRKAKRTERPTDKLIQLYALECFLDRLVHSEFADTFILKGGVLLAALDARRPTRDIDFAVRVFENSTEKVLSAVRTIAAIPLDDGMRFDSSGAAAEAIREVPGRNTLSSCGSIPRGRQCGRSHLARAAATWPPASDRRRDISPRLPAGDGTRREDRHGVGARHGKHALARLC